MAQLIILLFKGVSLGLIIAIPSTSQTVLCVQQTLNRGLIFGLISGLGVAVADSLFALAAGFGVQAISEWLHSYERIMQTTGALLILLFGVVTFFSQTDLKTDDTVSTNYRWQTLNAFIPTFLLTIFHPVTFLFFSAAFASMSLTSSANQYVNIALIGLGTFLGSMLWWGGLVWSITKFIRDKISNATFNYIKKISGALMGVLGAGLLIKYFFT